jgi:hypothetical protein
MEQSSQNTGQQQNRQQPVYDIRNGGHYGLLTSLSLPYYSYSFVSHPTLFLLTYFPGALLFMGNLTYRNTGASAAVCFMLFQPEDIGPGKQPDFHHPLRECVADEKMDY